MEVDEVAIENVGLNSPSNVALTSFTTGPWSLWMLWSEQLNLLMDAEDLSTEEFAQNVVTAVAEKDPTFPINMGEKIFVIKPKLLDVKEVATGEDEDCNENIITKPRVEIGGVIYRPGTRSETTNLGKRWRLIAQHDLARLLTADENFNEHEVRKDDLFIVQNGLVRQACNQIYLDEPGRSTQIIRLINQRMKPGKDRRYASVSSKFGHIWKRRGCSDHTVLKIIPYPDTKNTRAVQKPSPRDQNGTEPSGRKVFSATPAPGPSASSSLSNGGKHVPGSATSTMTPSPSSSTKRPGPKSLTVVSSSPKIQNIGLTPRSLFMHEESKSPESSSGSLRSQPVAGDDPPHSISNGDHSGPSSKKTVASRMVGPPLYSGRHRMRIIDSDSSDSSHNTNSKQVNSVALRSPPPVEALNPVQPQPSPQKNDEIDIFDLDDSSGEDEGRVFQNNGMSKPSNSTSITSSASEEPMLKRRRVLDNGTGGIARTSESESNIRKLSKGRSQNIGTAQLNMEKAPNRNEKRATKFASQNSKAATNKKGDDDEKVYEKLEDLENKLKALLSDRNLNANDEDYFNIGFLKLDKQNVYGVVDEVIQVPPTSNTSSSDGNANDPSPAKDLPSAKKFVIRISDETKEKVLVRICTATVKPGSSSQNSVLTKIGPQINVGDIIRIHRATVQFERIEGTAGEKEIVISTTPHLNYTLFNNDVEDINGPWEPRRLAKNTRAIYDNDEDLIKHLRRFTLARKEKQQKEEEEEQQQQQLQQNLEISAASSSKSTSGSSEGDTFFDASSNLPSPPPSSQPQVSQEQRDVPTNPTTNPDGTRGSPDVFEDSMSEDFNALWEKEENLNENDSVVAVLTTTGPLDSQSSSDLDGDRDPSPELGKDKIGTQEGEGQKENKNEDIEVHNDLSEEDIYLEDLTIERCESGPFSLKGVICDMLESIGNNEDQTCIRISDGTEVQLATKNLFDGNTLVERSRPSGSTTMPEPDTCVDILIQNISKVPQTRKKLWDLVGMNAPLRFHAIRAIEFNSEEAPVEFHFVAEADKIFD